MITRNLLGTNDFLFPNRNVCIEARESFDQAKNYQSLAEKMKAEYIPIENLNIKFAAGDTLVRKVMDKYKEMKGKSYNEKQALGSAILIAAKMARAAKTNNIHGFDIDNFKVGDRVNFSSDNTVEVAYTPRGSKERKTVFLDLSDKAAHEGVVDPTREALKGTRLEVFEESLRRMNVYNVTNSLGYNWGNSADKNEFLNKVQDLGYDRSRMGDMETSKYRIDLCGFIQGKIKEEGAKSIFDQLKSDSLALSDQEIIDLNRMTEKYNFSQGLTGLPEGERPVLEGFAASDATEQHILRKDTQRQIDETEKGLGFDTLPPVQLRETEKMPITPEDLQYELKTALEKEFPDIQVNVGVDGKTGKPTNPELTLTGVAGTESAYVTNTGDREDLEVWRERAIKTAKQLRRTVGRPLN